MVKEFKDLTQTVIILGFEYCGRRRLHTYTDSKRTCITQHT